jgi:hypothetical protein
MTPSTVETAVERPAALLSTTSGEARQPRPSSETVAARGFGVSGGSGGGGGGERARKRKAGGRRRSPALSKADWGPLGKHPDLEAIIARQRLHLPLSGRLSERQVNQAWKQCAGEHHPDRGGEHDTMQLVNGARDLLLGRSVA